MIVFGMFLVLFAQPLYAVNIPLAQSPLHLEEYYNQGTYAGTNAYSGALELNAGLDQGTWYSPVFYVDNKALWNTMEGEANWDAFGLNLISRGGAEEADATSYWFFSRNGVPELSANAHSGSRSFLLRPSLGFTYAQFSSATGIGGTTNCVADPKNIFPIGSDSVHTIFWVKSDLKHSEASPLMLYLFYDADQQKYCRISHWTLPITSIVPQMTAGFQRYQAEFNMTEDERPANAEYAAFLFPFGASHINGPQESLLIDDIIIFRDSRIKIRARTANNAGCTDFGPLSDVRLLYANLIAVPAPVARCIQFQITLNRNTDTGISPSLTALNMTFARAFDFTRPDFDRAPAVFSKTSVNSRSRGFVKVNKNGDMYFEGTGEPARFYGLQVEAVGLQKTPLTQDMDGNGFIDGADYGHALCSYMEKYGMNMIKFYIQGGSSTSDGLDEETLIRRNLTEWYSKFIPACESHGVYFFLRLVNPLYLDEHLPDVEHDGGFIGPIGYTDEEAAHVEQDYQDLILNFDMGGWTIKDDPAFVFFELTNEETLVFGWHQNAIDGKDPNPNIQPREISITWANRLRHHFNVFIREKYPTYADMYTAWNVPGDTPPFSINDGPCSSATYTNEQICNLSIITYQEAGWNMFSKRRLDTVDFLIKREEDYYADMRRHIQDPETGLGSHLLIAGGKPLLDTPDSAVSTEQLDIVDMHLYGNGIEHWGAAENWSIRISNKPIIQNWRDAFVQRSMQMRFKGKPFFLGETEYPPFGGNAPELIVQPILLSYLGVDGTIQFIYAKDYSDARMSLLGIPYEAPYAALAPTASRIFTRRDAGQPGSNITINLSRLVSLDFLGDSWNYKRPFYASWFDPAYLFIYNIQWESMNATTTIPPPLLPDLTPPYISDTGTVRYDIRNRRVVLDSPFTEGVVGNYDGEEATIGRLSFAMQEKQGYPTIALFLTSLDDTQPLATSSSLLLTAVGSATNSRMIWSTYHTRASKCADCQPSPSPFGTAPVWMGTVESQITLTTENAIRITPLDNKGAKKEDQAFIVAPTAGRATFSIGTPYDTPWYLIEPIILECEYQSYDPDCDGIITQQGMQQALADWLAGILPLHDLIQIVSIWKESVLNIGDVGN
jgi:hypothetical protein